MRTSSSSSQISPPPYSGRWMQTMERRLRELEDELARHTQDEQTTLRLSAEYQRLTEEFNRREGYAYEGEITGVLIGLGIGRDMFTRTVGTLSGGERTRLSLARLLLQKPEVLLMDEPTNHLDLEAIEWLQNYLTDYKGSLLVISHDRYFLDHVCTTMPSLVMPRSLAGFRLATSTTCRPTSASGA